MVDDLKSNSGNTQSTSDNTTPASDVKQSEHINSDINRFSMDDRGNIRGNKVGTVSAFRNTRIFISLGWMFAALAAFISPYFAVAGITLGILANRRARGSGNYIIAANVILAALNILVSFFGFFWILLMRRMFYGY